MYNAKGKVTQDSRKVTEENRKKVHGSGSKSNRKKMKKILKYGLQ